MINSLEDSFKENITSEEILKTIKNIEYKQELYRLEFKLLLAGMTEVIVRASGNSVPKDFLKSIEDLNKRYEAFEKTKNEKT